MRYDGLVGQAQDYSGAILLERQAYKSARPDSRHLVQPGRYSTLAQKTESPGSDGAVLRQSETVVVSCSDGRDPP